MPCRDYNDDGWEDAYEQRNRADMLARISCRSLRVIEELYSLMPNDQKEGTHIGNLLNGVLTDKEVTAWWPGHKKADDERMAYEARVAAEEAEKKRIADEKKAKKRAVLAKLSEEDRNILLNK